MRNKDQENDMGLFDRFKKKDGEAYLQKAEAAGYTNTKNIRNFVGL